MTIGNGGRSTMLPGSSVSMTQGIAIAFVSPWGQLKKRSRAPNKTAANAVREGGVKQMNSDLPRIISRKELKLIVPYSPQHILRLEKRGEFPKRVQIGSRRVGWYFVEIQAWLNSRERRPCMSIEGRHKR